jgi:photosystem II stability/assembly factor-like uncharacterized protein
MGAIAMGANSSTIYAGTGETNNSLDSNFGRGILVSTDSGATWTLTTGPGGVLNRLAVSQIAVDPTNANTAYAAVADFGNNGLCCSNTGIYKTTDAGATWTNVTAANGKDSTRPWSDVQIDGTIPTTIYAAHGDYTGNASNGVYKSTDSGASWSLLTNAPNGATSGRIAIAVSKSNHLVIYVTSQNPATYGLSKIERSDDGGATFTDLTAGTPNYMGGQGWYDTTVIVDPTNSAIMYVAGAAGTNSILRSTNSGVNWTDISSGTVSPHADHHAMAFDANGLLLEGDDGGIYRLARITEPRSMLMRPFGPKPTEVMAASPSLAKPMATSLTIKSPLQALARTSSAFQATEEAPGRPVPLASPRISTISNSMHPSSLTPGMETGSFMAPTKFGKPLTKLLPGPRLAP